MDERGRSHVFMTALVEVFGLSPFRARLRDVSASGCKLVTGMPLRPDEIVLLTMPVVGELVAFVVWSQKGFCGLRFEREIDADRMIGRDRNRSANPNRQPCTLLQWQPEAAEH